jgi:hypothetical protein
VRSGQYPSGYPTALPIHNTLSLHGGVPTAWAAPMLHRQFASQGLPIEDCDVYGAVDPSRPDVFDGADGEFQPPLPSFMDKWFKESDRQDSYELSKVDSPPSDQPLEVGAPPGKRSWPFAGNMSPAHLMDLHLMDLHGSSRRCNGRSCRSRRRSGSSILTKSGDA